MAVLGSGAPLRQFLYAKDLARVLVWAAGHYDSVEPIIVAPDEELSIRDVVGCICRAVHFDGPTQFDASAPDGPFRRTAVNARLRAQLPEFQFTPLEEAIRETVYWFEANYESARK